MGLRSVLSCAICSGALLIMGHAAPSADGGMISFTPDYFPPFASTGTIVGLSTPSDPYTAKPATCVAFKADHTGELYVFARVEAFSPGDRLFVQGNGCTICFTTLTCGQPALPLLNVKAVEISSAGRR